MDTLSKIIMLAMLSVIAFFVGLSFLVLLHFLVRWSVKSLHKKGKTQEWKWRKYVEDIELSPTIARFEQFLFYLAAIAGREVFSFAVAGWLVFKTVNKYARWKEPEQPEEPKDPNELPKFEERLGSYHREAALAHNRFQIFVIGTAMSIAAGGLAGVVYHYVLYLIPHLCRA